MNEATGREIHALNKEMIAAGVRKFACGLGSAKSLRAQADGGVVITSNKTRAHLFAAGLTALAISTAILPGDAMVPSNVLTRVFSIRVGSSTGSAFTIEVDSRQYLITARHIIGAATPSQLEVLRGTSWFPIGVERLNVEPAKVDIAVFALKAQLSPTLPVVVSYRDSYLSQEVFFLGYPYGLTIDGKQVNNGYPLPLVKHGIIASLEAGGRLGEPFLIDGINNPGFSGGPIIRAVGLSKPPIIIGVISGYRASIDPVYLKDQATSFSVQGNTGLIVAFPIDYALEAIGRHPVGIVVSPPAP